jgi:hypothetical protein
VSNWLWIATALGLCGPVLKHVTNVGVTVTKSVEFTIDTKRILQLFSDLRQIDLKEVRRKHREKQSDKD